MNLDDLLKEFRWDDEPATLAQIATVEAALQMAVPADFADFLITRGSGEGFVGSGSYLRINRLEDWPGRHEGLQAASHWPGLLLFGGDGANQLFGYDEGMSQYVEVDAIGDLDRRPLGGDFREFLNTLAAGV